MQFRTSGTRPNPAPQGRRGQETRLPEGTLPDLPPQAKTLVTRKASRTPRTRGLETPCEERWGQLRAPPSGCLAHAGREPRRGGARGPSAARRSCRAPGCGALRGEALREGSHHRGPRKEGAGSALKIQPRAASEGPATQCCLSPRHAVSFTWLQLCQRPFSKAAETISEPPEAFSRGRPLPQLT